MFYRRNQPGLPAVTAVLVLLWLLLVGYIIANPDPIGIIVLVVMGVFIAGPAIFVLAGVWRTRRRLRSGTPDSASSAGNGHDVSREQERDAHNGHHAPGTNGARQHEADEIPEEGSNNP